MDYVRFGNTGLKVSQISTLESLKIGHHRSDHWCDQT